MTLLHGDCLELMRDIPSDSIDLILCDLPYGTVKGLKFSTWTAETTKWDDRIDTEQLFKEYERILRPKGVAILFSQEPYTSHLRTHKQENLDFLYPLIWKKDSFGNPLAAKKAPVSYFEDISVFTKTYDTSCSHPLRKYAASVIEYTGLPKARIIDKIGTRVKHFFYKTGKQFSLPSAETYQALIDTYHIDEMEGFLTHEEMVKINDRYSRVFNLPEGKKSFSNVLEFPKDGGYHPTQKPVALLECLIERYTREGDVVLDNCMGSGSTGVACQNTNREFIGIELDDNYFKIACERLGQTETLAA